MQGLRQYILSVTAVALVGSVVLALLEKKGSASAMGRMLVGIFMMFTIISPLTHVRIGSIEDWLEHSRMDAQSAVAQGEKLAQDTLRQRIQEHTEAYILNKARQLGVQLQVQVTVSYDSIPTPTEVCLVGAVSPRAKAKLQQILAEDLGIPKENQLWN